MNSKITLSQCHSDTHNSLVCHKRVHTLFQSAPISTRNININKLLKHIHHGYDAEQTDKHKGMLFKLCTDNRPSLFFYHTNLEPVDFRIVYEEPTG